MFHEIASGPCPVPPPRLNIAEYVLAAGQETPDKIAMAILGATRSDRWSYARLRQAVADMAEWARQSAVPPSGRVLLRIGNSADFPVAFLGLIAAGRVPVPTSSALTEPEITAMAAILDPDLILWDGETALPARATTVVEMGDIPKAGAPFVCADTGSDDPAYIVFTSGSSGVPRGVVHAHRAVWARHMMFDGWYGLTREDRVMHAGAFNWTYTLGTGLLDPWSVGATALVPAPNVRSDQFPLLMARHDVTIFATVPGVFRRLSRLETWPKAPRLRHGLSAGEQLPHPVRVAWQDRTGTDIHEAFGMSECSTFLSGSPARPAPPGTLGYAQPGRRLAMIPEDHEAGQRLAIHRSDPGLMRGYLNDPEADDRHRDGDWFLTGDLVSQTTDGAIEYHGRSDDLITAGGFRVSPLEIERAILAHPHVTDAAAVTRNVSETTTVIALFFVADTALDEAVLEAQAARSLAPYKRPRVFVQRDHLPRSANGKLLRRHLRAPSERSYDQA